MHENGNLYAPVMPLARALGLQVTVDPRTKQVTVDGHPVQVKPATPTPKGIHDHEGAIFVPLKEFAAAAGLSVVIDEKLKTAGFRK